MKLKHSLLAIAAIVGMVGFSSCSESDDPIDEKTESGVDVGIGLSKKEVVVDYDEHGLTDTVQISGSDWVLSHVVFESVTTHYSQSSYVANLSAKDDFVKQFSWLTIKHSGGTLILEADHYSDAERETDQRWAQLIFIDGESGLTDTLTCYQNPDWLTGSYQLELLPSSVNYPKEGGSCRFTMPFDTFCFTYLTIGDRKDGTKYTLQNFDDVRPSYMVPFEPWSTTQEWITIDRDEELSFVVTVAPNTTGQPRRFYLTVEAGLYRTDAVGYQAAE